MFGHLDEKIAGSQQAAHAARLTELDDDLVVYDDHHDEAEADEPPAQALSTPSPAAEPKEAVNPLRMAAEAPIIVGVGGRDIERPAAFYVPLLTDSVTTPDETARPPPQEPRVGAVQASENSRGTQHLPVHFL